VAALSVTHIYTAPEVRKVGTVTQRRSNDKEHSGSLSFDNTKVLHQTLNPTAELRCKTLSRIKVDSMVLHRT